MQRLTVGDTYSGNLTWTRAVHMGGIRFGRDFALQPYRMTTPLPTLLGEVAVPSEVLASQRSHGDYRDIASAYGLGPARVNERAVVGWNSGALGSFGATWLHLRYPGEDASRYGSAFWNRNFGDRVSLSLD